MKKDLILKKLTKALLKYIIGIEVDDIRFVEKELKRIEKREADIVVLANIKGKEEIIHIEIQNQNDPLMPFRMLRYYTDIQMKFLDKKINQFLIYAGKSPLKMASLIDKDNLKFRYNLINLKKLDCEKFININTPESLVLAILCDFKQKDELEVILDILSRLKSILDDKKYADYVMMLEILAENRDLVDVVKKGEEMLRDVDLTRLPSFQLGLERGILKGKEEGKIEGKIEGIKEGEKKAKIEIAKKLLKDGFDKEFVANLTGLNIEDLND